MRDLTELLQYFEQNPEKIIFLDNNQPICAKQLLSDIYRLQFKLRQATAKRWLITHEHVYHFTVGLLALLISGCEPIILPNRQVGTLAQFADAYDDVLGDAMDFCEGAGSLSPATVGATPNLKGEKYSAPTKPISTMRDHIDPQQPISFFTSGSTGKAKRLSRTVGQLMAEIAMLEHVFGNNVADTTFYASVSHQHLYGFTFYLLWPLCHGRPIQCHRITTPNDIQQQPSAISKMTFISSPALLKRWTADNKRSTILTLFSSGGTLTHQDAMAVQQTLGIYPQEIYGSTETGAIATRQQQSPMQEIYWTPLPGVTVTLHQHCIQVDSPFVVNDKDPTINHGSMADCAVFHIDGTFALLGRADRIVNIEEHRVALGDIEQRLLAHPYVANAYALALDTPRQMVAVMIQLQTEGEQALEASGKLALNAIFKQQLSHYYPHSLLPKRFRYVSEIPINAEGKYLVADIKQHFISTVKLPDLLAQNRESLPRQALFTLSIPEHLIYFEGHFPDFPILSGVVQLNWAIHYAKMIWPQQSFASIHVEHLKFTRAIFPKDTVTLTLTRQINTLLFEYKRADMICAVGKIKMETTHD